MGLGLTQLLMTSCMGLTRAYAAAGPLNPTGGRLAGGSKEASKVGKKRDKKNVCVCTQRKETGGGGEGEEGKEEDRDGPKKANQS
jgi:hypothetical protein